MKFPRVNVKTRCSVRDGTFFSLIYFSAEILWRISFSPEHCSSASVSAVFLFLFSFVCRHQNCLLLFRIIAMTNSHTHTHEKNKKFGESCEECDKIQCALNKNNPHKCLCMTIGLSSVVCVHFWCAMCVCNVYGSSIHLLILYFPFANNQCWVRQQQHSLTHARTHTYQIILSLLSLCVYIEYRMWTSSAYQAGTTESNTTYS